jgi:integrase
LSEIFRGEYKLQPKKKNILVEYFVNEYLTYSEENKSKTSFDRDKTITGNFLAFIGHKGIRSISSFDIEKHKHERLKNVSKPTINRELDTIKNMFKKAVEWGYLKENPASTVQKYKLKERLYNIVSPDEERLILEHASPHLKMAIVIALNTGMRLKEILSLRWEDIDFQNRIIVIRETKNKTIRKVNINSLLADYLERAMKEKEIDHVIHYKGKPVDSIKRTFRHAIDKAGLKRFRFHDLRHTFASRLVMVGVDIRTVQ